MRQRLDPRAVDSQVRIERVCEPDALGLGGNAERLSVAIEAKGPGSLDQFELRLGVAKKQHLSRAVGVAVDHVQSIRGLQNSPPRARDLKPRGPLIMQLRDGQQ
jgi:hypothetical protein